MVLLESYLIYNAMKRKKAVSKRYNSNLDTSPSMKLAKMFAGEKK